MKIATLLLCLLLVLTVLSSCSEDFKSEIIDEFREEAYPKQNLQPTPDSLSDFIGKERAKEIAAEHHGTEKDNISFIKLELDNDDGRWIYEVEYTDGFREFEVDIDAYNGDIISWES